METKELKIEEIKNIKKDFFMVVRQTDHPAEDLSRNWSAQAGGWCLSTDSFGFDSIEEAQQAEMEWNGYETIEECKAEWLFHPAYNCFVEKHYNGLGAWLLENEIIEEAIKEVQENKEDFDACTSEKGDGHFYAEDCLGFIKVQGTESLYIFIITD